MKDPRELYPYVLIIGGALVIVLALVMLYMLERLQETYTPETEATPVSVVGMEAEPDSRGWKPLFNGTDLDGWEITNFGPQGPVFVRDSAIIMSFGDGPTGITWTKSFPVINYEISFQAMRVDGNDFFSSVTFPVRDEHCTLITGGWGGSLVGLSSIDGVDASENFTRTGFPFENRRWYNFRLSVGEDLIRCFIDGEEVITVPIEEHTFSIRSEVRLARPLGITTWVTTGAVRNIRFREI